MVVYGAIFALLIHSVTCTITLKEPEILLPSKLGNDISKMMGSMTAYSMHDKLVGKDKCTPIKAWVLLRHGAKYPSEDILNDVAKLVTGIQPVLKQLYGSTKSDEYKNLPKQWQKIMTDIINWKNFMTDGSHKNLNKRGEKDMTEFGKRMRTSLKTLLTKIKLNEIEVLTAEEDRCYTSAELVVKELFQNQKFSVPIERNTKKDKRLKLAKLPKEKVFIQNPEKPGSLINPGDLYFEKNCPEITKKIKNNLFPQFVKNGTHYRKLITNDVVKAMYYACGYSFLSEPPKLGLDAWCKVFTVEDIQMFENMNDIEYNYKNGYHLEENRYVSNPMTKDILQFLMDHNGKKFKLFLGHTSNCLGLITRFNLFRDKENITVENINKIKNRKWKSSFMTPVACNFIVKVFDCGSKSNEVSLYLNEIPIQMINGKRKCVQCPIEEVIEYFQQLNL